MILLRERHLNKGYSSWWFHRSLCETSCGDNT